MSLIQFPRQFVVDINGVPRVGAQAFFYQPTTSTDIATWKDAAYTQPHTQPVKSVSSGIFPAIYINPAVNPNFKIIVLDVNDALVYSDDNVPALALTAGNISDLLIASGGLTSAAIKYDRTAAEIAENITPVDYSHPPGSYLRYDADPLGLADSSAAIANAIKANAYVFDDYPGGGTYLLNSEVTFTRFPVRIEGQARSIPNAVGGTRFRLAASAGAGKGSLHSTGASTGVEIVGICCTWEDPTIAQWGVILAADTRDFIIDRCGFVGTGASGSLVSGVKLDTGGTYITGEILNCFSNGVVYAVDAQGSCTGVNVRGGRLFGNITGGPVGAAVQLSALCSGPTVSFAYIQGFDKGVYALAGHAYVGVGFNTFEANTTSYELVQNGSVYMGDAHGFNRILSGGNPVVPYNNTGGCLVWDQPGFFRIDKAVLKVYQGFNEFNRAANLGVMTTVAYAGGNFTANGGATLTVDSGDQSTFEYSINGTTMTVALTLAGITTTVASPTQLIVALPLSSQAVKAVQTSAVISISGTRELGVARVTAGGTSIIIERQNAATGFGIVANAIDVACVISFETTA
jgi:hypothetical protein